MISPINSFSLTFRSQNTENKPQKSAQQVSSETRKESLEREAKLEALKYEIDSIEKMCQEAEAKNPIEDITELKKYVSFLKSIKAELEK